MPEPRHGRRWYAYLDELVAAVELREWLRSRANSIEGGTSEVQLNIIAKRVLQLPGA